MTSAPFNQSLHLLQPLYLGTDLVYLPRLYKVALGLRDKFFARLLTRDELVYCRGTGAPRESVFMQRAAGRIAVKEAVAKALGTGLNGLGWGEGIHWTEVEIVSKIQSPPELVLNGRALEVSTGLGIRGWRFSLSHDGDYAMATVIGLV